ncbi:helix-turn-helix domain-containing protein [Cellulomonas sp. APG4]|uniref:helix-turn-helix domain-containing protein n=1 Tax=Cellulomonas sp. APG4 TaxID=1538656 RepID=UPI001379AE36|nr:helix-turn-helix domain-containing protein [Cellulomonas sp. APG4]NCT91974.1 helix-turn-helix domain-containing protein [Cellulomonas sp. APG4]
MSTQSLAAPAHTAPAVPYDARLALAPTEVAQLLGVHPATVYRRLADGSLPARRDGRRTLVLRADLDAYLNDLPTRATTRTHPTPHTEAR